MGLLCKLVHQELNTYGVLNQARQSHPSRQAIPQAYWSFSWSGIGKPAGGMKGWKDCRARL